MASRRGIYITISVLAILLLILAFSYLLPWNRGDKVKWLWELVPPLTLNDDGFVYLSDAVAAFHAEAGINSDIISNVVAAANCAKWTASPNMRSFLPMGGERYSDKLTNGTAEIDYSGLIDLSNALCDYGVSAATDGNVQEAQIIAIAMLRLGYQIARNKEDVILGTLRINLWKCGANILHQTKYIDNGKYNEIVAKLNTDFQSMSKRDLNRLYPL